MPCQLNNIQFDDSTLQPLFARIETAIPLSTLVLAGWQFALRLTVLLIEETLDLVGAYPIIGVDLSDNKLALAVIPKRNLVKSFQTPSET